MKYQIFLPDARSTLEIGAAFGEKLKAEMLKSENECFKKREGAGSKGVPIVVFLQGVLGAGKTSFCGGVLSAFGHSGAVKSPTYTLVEPYVFDHINIYHFDLYRLGDPEELDYMGIRDYFNGQSIALIEWPDKGRGFLPQVDLVVSLAPLAKEEKRTGGRELRCVAHSTRGESILSQMF